MPGDAAIATSVVAGIATGGVIIRPFKLPEAIWAVLGALALVVFGLLPWRDALAGVTKGVDVYLFLVGMMLLAELARREGLFDWLASRAVAFARGSPTRLFVLVYIVGTVVTAFLSNDATAMVLTPAVYAATKAAGARPLPYLFICAFIANAASFVLPISNPANLVIFGARMPSLVAWLAQFAAPSIAAIVVTLLALYLTQRSALASEKIALDVDQRPLGFGGRLAGLGIGAIAVVLLACSALDLQLGLPTFLCGVTTTALVLAIGRQSPWPVLAGVSWSVLPLVAGLFVLVESLDRTGLIRALSEPLHAASAAAPAETTWGVGALVAIACNFMNNLPVGLIVGSVNAASAPPADVLGAMLIGVDLGPNLSVTGSLATILWLVAIRREGIDVTAWRFLKLGLIVTPPALAASLLALTALS
jgi:arsenical pump membrane protein